MSLQQKIESDYKQSFKANDRAAVSALRMLKSVIKNREIDVGRELTDQETVEVIAKEVKRRREAAKQYEQGGRSELAQRELADVSVYNRYLPPALSEAEISRVIDETISRLGAAGAPDIGKVMGAVMNKLKGRADGGVVQALVRKRLEA